MSMMGSSKYEFGPEKFEDDVKAKLLAQKDFKDNLMSAIYKEYYYADKKTMPNKEKRRLMAEVFSKFIEGDELDAIQNRR